MTTEIYLSHAIEDEALFRELATHLAVLEHQDMIRISSSHSVTAGDRRDHAIEERMQSAHLILLLISAHFLASKDCCAEMERAISLQQAKKSDVLAILLRACSYGPGPISQLEILPEPSKPVYQFPDRDEAWESIMRTIRGRITTAAGGPKTATSTDLTINPFEYGTPVPPDRFAGRSLQRTDIKARIGGISAQSVSVVGLYRSGKSSLLRYIRERTFEFCTSTQRPLVVMLDLQRKHLHTPEGILEGLRREIHSQTGQSPWNQQHSNDGFAVDDGLEDLRNSGIRLLVMLDELECIGARLDRFQDWGEDFRAKATAGYFALVLTTRRPIEEIYGRCGLTSPFGNIFSTVTLGALLESEWRALVRGGFDRIGTIPSEADMRLIDDLAGGLPYYVQMAATLLWQHRDHQSTRKAFNLQATERFRELWTSLPAQEQSALHLAAEAGGHIIPPQILDGLVRMGLLRPEGRLFSSAFAAFVRQQR